MIYRNLPRNWYKSVSFVYLGNEGYNIPLKIKSVVTNSKYIIFKLEEIDCCFEELYMFLGEAKIGKWKMDQYVRGSIRVEFNIEPVVTIKWSKRK